MQPIISPTILTLDCELGSNTRNTSNKAAAIGDGIFCACLCRRGEEDERRVLNIKSGTTLHNLGDLMIEQISIQRRNINSQHRKISVHIEKGDFESTIQGITKKISNSH